MVGVVTKTTLNITTKTEGLISVLAWVATNLWTKTHLNTGLALAFGRKGLW